MGKPVVIIAFEHLNQFGQAIASMQESAGYYIEQPLDFELRTHIQLKCQASFLACPLLLDAEIVMKNTLNEGFGYGLQFMGEWQSAIRHVQIKQSPAQEEKEEEISADQTYTESIGKDADSLFEQIKKMNMSEKIQLAVRAGKEERRVLFKQGGPSVQPYLLKNPKIGTDEIVQIVRSSQVNVEMLITISQNKDWVKNPQVRLALIKNPKTPPKIVQEHISFLQDQDLVQIAKSEHVRETVAKMARKILAQKGKKI